MAKLTRIGSVWETKASTPENPKYFLKMGQSNPAKPQYDITVEVTVKNAKGEVLSQSKDGYITLMDPRKSQYASPNLPEKLLFDVLIGSEDNQA